MESYQDARTKFKRTRKCTGCYCNCKHKCPDTYAQTHNRLSLSFIFFYKAVVLKHHHKYTIENPPFCVYLTAPAFI